MNLFNFFYINLGYLSKCSQLCRFDNFFLCHFLQNSNMSKQQAFTISRSQEHEKGLQKSVNLASRDYIVNKGFTQDKTRAGQYNYRRYHYRYICIESSILIFKNRRVYQPIFIKYLTISNSHII